MLLAFSNADFSQLMPLKLATKYLMLGKAQEMNI